MAKLKSKLRQKTVVDKDAISGKKAKVSEEESKVEIVADDKEEKELESFLFGTCVEEYVLRDREVLVQDEIEQHTDEENNGLLSFAISTAPSKIDDDEIQEIFPIQSTEPHTKKRRPAWIDNDDSEINVDIENNKYLKKLRTSVEDKCVSGLIFQERLKTQFEQAMPAPAWADLYDRVGDDSENEEDDEKIFKTTTRLLSKSEHLPKGILNINRVKDLDQQSNATISSLEFHPSAKIAFTASLNNRLNVFQADGKENKKLQSIYLKSFPIHTAHFSSNGDRVVMSSRRKFYYIYDLVGGQIMKIPGIRGHEEKSLEKFVLSPDGNLIAFLSNSGYVNLVSLHTNQWISSVKINGKVSCAAFSADSSKLFSGGSDGEVYIWDVKSRQCQHRFTDEGSLNTTSIALSNNGEYVALGSSSGVVNIYDDKCLLEKHPSPVKALMNITTSVEQTKFNSTSEVLAYYSAQGSNSLKMVHFPSLTAFSNWPIHKQNLGHVTTVDFSPHSGYVGVGNESGKAMLFRLNHYKDS